MVSVTGAEVFPRIGLPKETPQNGAAHGTDGSRAPSPNDTPTVFRPSPAGSAAVAAGPKSQGAAGRVGRAAPDDDWVAREGPVTVNIDSDCARASRCPPGPR